ncbi:methyltransferase domain-containing protein [Ideonella sp.]|uniref:methyltransferase domain-containing protein n=1 Tax=Ideonella sp. TaxID=1929293 RepID=UPI0035B2D9E1
MLPSRVDAVAARRALARLARAPESPWLHQEAARRMGERLAWIKRQPEQVLDWSGASGGCHALLAEAYPRAQLMQVVDVGMSAEPPASPWWRRWSRGGPQRVAAPAVPAAAAALVWSNMRLHFAPDPLPLLRDWRRALAPDGFLMFSTLGPGSLALLRGLYQAADWGEAHAPFVDMHDLGDMLVETGFAEPVMDQETLTLTYTSPEALLDELHGLGANLAPQRFGGLRTRRWRDALQARLAQQADEAGRLSLTFELVYGHAFRAADAGPRVEAQTQIGLDDMKLMLRHPRPRK